MDTSELAKRMKKYEAVPKNVLMRRTPVIMRIDGRAFHTFTRGFVKPFDELLVQVMQDTMKYLCENIQGCVLGYTESDEITLVLTDYRKLNSDAWFDYEVQKMCSIAASMATMEFNRQLRWQSELYEANATGRPEEQRRVKVYADAVEKGAMFDCRVFNVPKEEVTNNLYWRQLDAGRNSVQMLGQEYFRHKELQYKSSRQIRDMLFSQGIDWTDLPTHLRRGSCCIKTAYDPNAMPWTGKIQSTQPVEREHWVIDKEIPVFKDAGRDYVNSRIYIDETEN